MIEYRILNRIIFINIASFEYEVVELNGNTCFVGANNSGKTTIMRAILFFYNANQQKLGISFNTKKTFEKYYFQDEPAYIIYEIATEKGYFHVLVYRKRELYFRFFDTEFKKELYISKDNIVFQPKKIIENCNTATPKIKYSNQIDTFENYRKIIYGDYDKKHLRFSILKSIKKDGKKMYNNIWKAITNIFLSSTTDIEADFVKKFIANATSDKITTIKLDQIKMQLYKFNQKIDDIKIFQKNNFGKKYSNNIIDNYDELQKLKSNNYQIINKIASSYKYAKQQIELLKIEIDKKENEIKQKQKTLINVEKKHKVEMKKKNQEIGGWNSKLKDAKKFKQKYDNFEDFENILKENAKKEEYETEKEQSEKEYNSLTAPLYDINTRFEILFSQLEIEKKQFEMTTENKGFKIDENRYQKEKEINKEYNENEKKLEAEQNNSKEEINEQTNKLKFELKAFKYKKKEIENKKYFKDERYKINKNIKDTYDKITKRKQEQTIKTNDINSKKNINKAIKNQYEEKINQKINDFNSEIKKLKIKIEKINKRIQNFDNTLYSYLENNLPDWKNNIGKVCKNEILFDIENIEKNTSDNKKNIYGLELDLSQLPEFTHTIEKHKKDKKIFLQEIKDLENKRSKEIEIIQKEKNSKLSSNQSKITEFEKDIRYIKYYNKIDTQKIEKLELAKRELIQKIEQERKNDLTKLSEQEKETNKKIQEFYKVFETINLQFEKNLKEFRRIKNRKIKQINENHNVEFQEIEQSKIEKKEYFVNKKQKINKLQKKALKEKNIDIKKIDKIKNEIEDRKNKLENIKNNYELVLNYKNHKRDLFDKIDYFKAEKKKLNNFVERTEQTHEIKKQKYDNEIEKLKKSKGEIKNENNVYQTGIKNFEDIKTKFEEYKIFIEKATAQKQEEELQKYINNWYSNKDNLRETKEKLKSLVDYFTSKFQKNNHFEFKIPVEKEKDTYEKFAEFLSEFIKQNRLEQSVTELATQFTMLIDNISGKVINLKSNFYEIDRTVGKLKKDFSEAFDKTKLIEYIKIKAEENKENKILKRLDAIVKYREENFDFYNNITFDFSKKNKLADEPVELIINLIDAIDEKGDDEIAIVDLFNIYFKIKEGNNETDWINKLKDIGSDGTDILVKSIVFITLLDVFIKKSTTVTQQFRIHCIIDEVGKISAQYLKELINFANKRNIFLINGLPNESKLERKYNYTYKLTKEDDNKISINPLLTHFIES